MKVITLVGTRPEIIKLSRVIPELDRRFRHVLVHSGQNYDDRLSAIFFRQLDIRKPDYFLGAARPSAAETIGRVIIAFDEVLKKEKPDALLILGDTNSCLGAISAKRRKIPIFHMEAGNRCFDQRVPEEINRKIIDHISDINMPYTEHARRYLVMEGLRPETVIKTGSPMKEVLDHYMPRISAAKTLVRMKLRPKEYFVFSSHREENIDHDAHFKALLESLNAIARKYGKPVIVSTHPRTRKRLAGIARGKIDARVRFVKPLGFIDYIQLQMKAFCTLSDSGTITEEASILGFPAVTIREAHERPEGMDEGTLIMSGLTPGRILESIEIVTSGAAEKDGTFRIVRDYDVDNVSRKVARIIMSYTEYVDRTVWHKEN
jgi:UDP-N-acetylglucosamine 2-epimerase (non-hydrolysing)